MNKTITHVRWGGMSLAIVIGLAACQPPRTGADGGEQDTIVRTDSVAAVCPDTVNKDCYGTEPGDMVVVDDVLPEVKTEIRYATDYNFVGEVIDGYDEPIAILTRQATDSLRVVNDELRQRGLCLKIYDGYRPKRAVAHFMRWGEDIQDTRMKEVFYPEMRKEDIIPGGFLARRSRHSCGSTVDLTLYDMAAEQDVDMGSPFDYFGEASSALAQPGQKIGTVTPLTEEQYRMRQLLRETMMRHGFRPYDKEWWHFTLRGEPHPKRYFDFPNSREGARQPL